MRETERRERGRHRLSQEDKGTVRRRDGAAGQVCLRERIPGTPQPAGVRPGYKRAAEFLHPLRCYYPRKESEESEGKSRHNITIKNRTRSAAGTAQLDRIPNLNPIGGWISTTQSNHGIIGCIPTELNGFDWLWRQVTRKGTRVKGYSNQ